MTTTRTASSVTRSSTTTRSSAALSGRYKPYPRYKDSGVEWLGKIPEDWEIRKVAHVFRIGSGTTPDSDNMSYYGGDIPWVTTSELRETTIFETTKTVTETALADFSALQLFPGGSLAIAMYGATIGRLGILGVPATVNQACCVFSEPRGVDIKFAFYWMQMRRPVLVSLSSGGGQPNLSQDVLRAVRLCLPGQDEQRAIAEFLDQETAKIDNLIARKERLIELLEEKRSALITHAIIRGLDPNAPLRDSGIEWLGQIPAHWEAVMVKRIGRIRYGLGQPPRELADGLPMIRATDLHAGKITADQLVYVDPNDVPWDRNPELRENEIIVVRSGAYTGDSAIVPREFAGAISGYDMVVTVTKADPSFVAWALLSRYILVSQIGLICLRAAQPHLNAEELGSCIIIRPPIDEQRRIVEHIEQAGSQMNAVASKVHAAIKRLKEYRAALITAVVTGKIDVRDEVKLAA